MTDTSGAEGTDTIAETFMAELGDREVGSLLDFDDEPEFVEVDEADADEDAVEEDDEATPDEDTDDEAEADESETNVEDEVEDESDEPVTDKYRVKVDGEEIEVTLEEALAGYQRQADYTRKTQELAAERETFSRLDTALALSKDSFDRTIEQLREAYGYKAETAEETFIEEEPWESELRELKAWKAQQEQERDRERKAREVDTYVAQLQQADPELDKEELFQIAIDTQAPSLKAAYEIYKARKITAKAEAEAAKAREAKVAAKRKAKVAPGSRRQSKAIADGGETPKGLDNIIEAVMAGKPL